MIYDNGTTITYYNTAEYNRSGMSISNSDVVDYSSPAMIKYPDLTPARYGSFEKNGMRAGGLYKFYDGEEVGFLSSGISGEDGAFPSNSTPYIELGLGSNVTVPGVTLFFGIYDWQYCSKVKVTYTKSDESTVVKYYYPNGNEYFCDYSGTIEITKVRIDFLETSVPYNHARLYRFELGQIAVFCADNDNLVTADLRITANLSADEVEANSSSFTVHGAVMYGLKKEQKYTIHHNGNFLSTHYVDEIIQQGNGLINQKGRFTVNGVDIIGIFNEYISPITEFAWNTFGSWIAIYIAATKFDKFPITFDDEAYANVNIYGKCDSRIMKRTLLQKLAFAAGCYIDTTVDGTIHVKPLKTALAADVSSAIPETQVFSGDQLETKQPYKYIRIRLNDDNYDSNRLWSIANPNAEGSTAVKEFNLDFIPQNVDGLLSVLSGYYFKNRFYNAKAVVGYEPIGSRVKINNVDSFILTREYNLDGDKLIAQGEYKCYD